MTTPARSTACFATILLLQTLGLATLPANDDLLTPQDVAVMKYVLSSSI